MKCAQTMIALMLGMWVCIGLAGCAAVASDDLKASDTAATTEPCAYAVYEAQQGEIADAEFAEKLSAATILHGTTGD